MAMVPIMLPIIASLLAQGATPVQAAACGVWLHGRAVEMAAQFASEYGVTPEDVVQRLPAAILEILE